MGVRSDLFNANASEARSLAESERPELEWSGMGFDGLDNVKLATLWGILDGGTPNSSLEEHLDALKAVISLPDQGALVFELPQALIAYMAIVSGFEPEARNELAAKWAQAEEFESWDESEVQELLQGITDLADMARLESKTLLLRISP